MKRFLLILIVTIVTIGIGVSCTPNKPTVNWNDSVYNIENAEYVDEVYFQEDYVLSDEQLQWLFCKRYYETLGDSSLTWFNNTKFKDLKGISN